MHLLPRVGCATVFILGVACNRHNNPAIVALNMPNPLPNGWTLAKSDDGAVSLGVAPGWRSGVDKIFDQTMPSTGVPDASQPAPDPGAQSSDLSKMLGKMGEDMAAREKEDEKKQIAALRSKGIIIQVLDSSKGTIGEARTNYCVKIGHFDYNPTLEEGVQVEKKRFLASVNATKVKLPIGDAMRMDETRDLRDGGVLTLISYIVVNNHDLYCLRFTAEGPADMIKNLADPVAQTLRIAK